MDDSVGRSASTFILHAPTRRMLFPTGASSVAPPKSSNDLDPEIEAIEMVEELVINDRASHLSPPSFDSQNSAPVSLPGSTTLSS